MIYNNSRNDYRRRMAQRRRRQFMQKLPIIFLALLLIAVLGCGAFVIIRQLRKPDGPVYPGAMQSTEKRLEHGDHASTSAAFSGGGNSGGAASPGTDSSETATELITSADASAELQVLLDEADRIAAG